MPGKFHPAPGYTVLGKLGESNGPRLVVGSWATLALAIIGLILRMTVKIFFVHHTAWEDYLSITALLLAIARTIMLTMSKCSLVLNTAKSLLIAYE